MELLTKKELAAKLKISERKITYDVQKGMPAMYFGGSVRFELDEVIKWYKDQKEKE